MSKLPWFVLGVSALLALILVGGSVVLMGAHGFSAREQPSAVERWIARRARSMAVPESSKALTNPTSESPEVLADARAHWADHCAACHANNGSGDTEMGKHLYPPAPDMRAADTQDMTDGELFYIIQNGVRLTGMPAWGSGSGHDTQDSWKLVRFIRRLPKLSAEEQQEMEQMNPKTPDEWKEEQEEREFLNGGESHEHAHHDHH
jgi:mono/diheme cytochrome c family protein